jgi:toxin CptA
MSISRRSSNASAPCRFEWRPSRWLAVALAGLGVLGAGAVLASELPRPFDWLIAMAALYWGLRQGRSELRRQPRQLVWAANGSLDIDGDNIARARLRWRGPIAFLDWYDGAARRRVLAWWPDTLAAPQRRELRLAAARAVSAATRPSMAP